MSHHFFPRQLGPENSPPLLHCTPKHTVKLPLCSLMTRLIQMHPSTRHTCRPTSRPCLMNKCVACLPAARSLARSIIPLPLLNPAGWLAACPPAALHANSGSRPLRIAVPQSLPVACCWGRTRQAARQQDSVVAVSHTWLEVSDNMAGNTFVH